MIWKNKKNKFAKIKLRTVLIAVIVLLVVLLVALAIAVYFFPFSGKIAQKRIVGAIIRHDPLPAAIVGINFVSIAKLDDQLKSVQRFYENQDFSTLGMRVDFSTPDGKKRLSIKEEEILNKLVHDSIIKKEAQKRNITLTADMINQQVDRKLKEYGTGDTLQKNLQRLYGWNLDDFKKNIVEPDLYRGELFASIRKSDPSYTTAEKKIQEAKTALDGGMDFSEVAQKYSEGETASSGGELGWFSSEQMLPEVLLKIYSLKAGETSEIIESSIGYHIVKLEDKKVENGENLFKISQIFVRTQTFSDWLQKTTQKYKIFIPLHEFRWNSQTGSVEFRDTSMNQYAKDIQSSNSDDPSMLF